MLLKSGQQLARVGVRCRLSRKSKDALATHSSFVTVFGSGRVGRRCKRCTLSFRSGDISSCSSITNELSFATFRMVQGATLISSASTLTPGQYYIPRYG